jgi:beta-mannanase
MDNRQRLSPTQILYDKDRKTYERVKAFNKPIIIDEVATTSVRYKENYNFEKSRTEYLNHDERKDYWLHQLREFLINRPEITAAIYFNTDYTHGLSFKVT